MSIISWWNNRKERRRQEEIARDKQWNRNPFKDNIDWNDPHGPVRTYQPITHSQSPDYIPWGFYQNNPGPDPLLGLMIASEIMSDSSQTVTTTTTYDATPSNYQADAPSSYEPPSTPVFDSSPSFGSGDNAMSPSFGDN